MPAPSWTDDHARRVSETVPPVPTPTEVEVDRVWRRVSEVVTAPATPRRARRRVAFGVGAAVIVLGTSGIAVANIWSARTGDYNTNPESVRLGGPGELIDPRGADFEQVLIEEIADIPFPSNAAHEIAVADQLRDARRAARGMRIAQARGDAESDYLMQYITGGLRAEAARQAICGWANVWAAATTAGDTEGRAEAIAMIEASRTWPAVTDVDDQQTITTKKQWVTDAKTGKTQRESYVDNTVFGYLPLLEAAAQGEDLRAVGRPLMDSTRCIPELMRDLPAAVPAEFRVQ